MGPKNTHQKRCLQRRGQVALCLLEVGRRSAALRLGLPAPQLVRLEEEIDAEMLGGDDDDDDDDSSVPSTTSDDDDDDESTSNSLCRSRSVAAAAAARRIKPPSVVVTRQNGVEAGRTSTTAVDSTSHAEQRGSAWQRRRYRPIIPVDMMSLDEMVSLSRISRTFINPRLRYKQRRF